MYRLILVNLRPFRLHSFLRFTLFHQKMNLSILILPLVLAGRNQEEFQKKKALTKYRVKYQKHIRQWKKEKQKGDPGKVLSLKYKFYLVARFGLKWIFTVRDLL